MRDFPTNFPKETKVDLGRIAELRLSLQRALMGEISPAFRAVAFSASDGAVDVRCYFDGPIAQEDRISVSCMRTEVLADFESELEVSARCIRMDFPDPISDEGFWVYRRRE